MTDNLEEQEDVQEDVEEQEETESPIEGNTQEDNTIKRYKEQISWSKKEADRLRTVAIEVAYNNWEATYEALEKLYEKDPRLADEVAKKYSYDDFKDLKKSLKKTNDEYIKSDNRFDQSEFDRLYNERKSKEEHEKALKKVETVFNKLDDDVKQNAKKYFEKITKWQKLTVDEAMEYAEMTTLFVNKDRVKQQKYESGLWDIWSTWVWVKKTTTTTSKNNSQQQMVRIIRKGKLVLIPKSND